MTSNCVVKKIGTIIATAVSNAKKVLHWGPSGVITYLKQSGHRSRIQRLLKKTIRGIAPEKGITIVGIFTQYGSPSKTIRDLAFALKQAGIKCQTFNTDPNPLIPEEEIAEIMTPVSDFALDRYSHIIEIFPSVIPWELPGILKSRIAFWEFESGFQFAYPDMAQEKSVVAMSDFNARYFRSILPQSCKVSKMLFPFRYVARDIPTPSAIRAKFGIGEDDFMVLYNFDYGGSYYRKNPEGAMVAFTKAFKGVQSAKLVFKTKSARANSDKAERLRHLAKELGIENSYIEIDNDLPFDYVLGLANSCDVYLSLHRGEGFGMTVAEAMAMGKPVLSTDYSSTTEFCCIANSFPIPCSMVDVQTGQVDHPYYRKVEKWAEPDLDYVANVLVSLHDNASLRREIGEKASKSILKQFSVDEFRKSVEAFMEECVWH